MTAESIELMNGRTADSDTAGCGSTDHVCSCGAAETEAVVLDGRTIPHAVRHAAIFGALGSIRPGFALDLIAPHDPLPLLAQLQETQPGAFTTSYLDRGPEFWKIRFTRAN
jgi:uncharacterized protein (DUF2249 family)